jgi:3',5'-cyclic AMP phosphodiesterase CpdA
MKAPLIPRRAFLTRTAVSCAPFILPWEISAEIRSSLKAIRLGLCADPHKDIMHDADERLQVFIDAVNRDRPDFILQLGDFCCPYDRNRSFLNIWEQFKGPRYHTLGNHDRDGGFAWQQVQDFLGMPHRYYSFDQGGWHFVVLDGNERNPINPEPGYPRYIGSVQLDWLRQDLGKAKAATIVFSHQSLEDEGGLENRSEVRAVLEAANAAAGWRKVGLCLSGHHHIDFQRVINGIQYVQVNSMSYCCVRCLRGCESIKCTSMQPSVHGR